MLNGPLKLMDGTRIGWPILIIVGNRGIEKKNAVQGADIT